MITAEQAKKISDDAKIELKKNALIKAQKDFEECKELIDSAILSSAQAGINSKCIQLKEYPSIELTSLVEQEYTSRGFRFSVQNRYPDCYYFYWDNQNEC